LQNDGLVKDLERLESYRFRRLEKLLPSYRKKIKKSIVSGKRGPGKLQE
jgi:hypothetical protein